MHGLIDDLLLLSQPKEELTKVMDETAILLWQLGFLINREKSVMQPCREITYLGFIVNSAQMTLTLLEEKLEKIVQECSSALNQHRLLIRALARMIWRMSAAT